MKNLQDRENKVQGSLPTGAREERDALSELRHLLLAPEQDQLDRLEQRLDAKVARSDLVTIEQALNSKNEQLLKLEHLLNQEKIRLIEVEGNIRSQQEELRTLEQRLTAETEQLALLREKFANKTVTAADVSDVLHQAVDLRRKEDSKLSFALAPIIGDALETLIKKSPQKIVAVLGPKLGEMIGEYVRTAIREFTEEINEVVNHSLTTQAIKWRFEAYVKGVSYPELYFSRTLRYRVEQVFLIQKDSGLPLCQVTKGKVGVLNEDAVSAMLTAILAFVNDSFAKEEKQERVNYINVGNYKILVEHGPEAILAGVVKGASPPPNLSTQFKETLDKIHLRFKDEFLAFDGDTNIFESASEDLKYCLREERNKEFAQKEEKPKFSKGTLVLGACVLTVLVGGFVWWFRESESQQLTRLLEEVKNQQGLVSASITQNAETGPVLRILRDSRISEVISNVTEIFQREGIDIPIKEYMALGSMDIQKMVMLLLTPPTTVTLTVDNDVLVASGSANHDWIKRFESSPTLLPGINQINRNQLVDEDLRAIEELKHKLESYEVRFEQGRASLSSDAREELKVFSSNIQILDNVLQRLDKRGKIEVYGHTSPEGSMSRNQRIASERANNVIRTLNVSGLEVLQIVPVGLASQDDLSSEFSDEDLSKKRRITLRVIVNK